MTRLLIIATAVIGDVTLLLGSAVEINATIFVQIFIFMSLLLWLSHTLFTPILALFEEREKRIGGAKREAQEMIGIADEKARQFEQEYEKARSEARLVLTGLKHDTDKEQAALLALVREQAKEKIDRAQALLDEEEKSLRAHMSPMSDSLAKDIVATLFANKV